MATFKSNGSGGMSNERSAPFLTNGGTNGKQNGHLQTQQQQRKIGSIADYDPLAGFEATPNGINNDRFGRSVFSTGNLHNGSSSSAASRAPAYNSTSNIGNYATSNGNGNTNGNGNGYGNHYHKNGNGVTNGVVTNGYNNHNLEYDISGIFLFVRFPRFFLCLVRQTAI